MYLISDCVNCITVMLSRCSEHSHHVQGNTTLQVHLWKKHQFRFIQLNKAKLLLEMQSTPSFSSILNPIVQLYEPELTQDLSSIENPVKVGPKQKNMYVYDNVEPT